MTEVTGLHALRAVYDFVIDALSRIWIDYPKCYEHYVTEECFKRGK